MNRTGEIGDVEARGKLDSGGTLWILTADGRAGHLVRGRLTPSLGLEIERLDHLVAGAEAGAEQRATEGREGRPSPAPDPQAFGRRLAQWVSDAIRRWDIDRIHAFVAEDVARAMLPHLSEEDRARIVDQPLVLERLLPRELKVHEAIASLWTAPRGARAPGPDEDSR